MRKTKAKLPCDHKDEMSPKELKKYLKRRRLRNQGKGGPKPKKTRLIRHRYKGAKGFPGAVQKFSFEEVEDALWQCEGKITYAAKLLKCSYPTVVKYIERFPDLRLVQEATQQKIQDDARHVVIKNMEIAKDQVDARLDRVSKLKKKERLEIQASMGIDTDSMDAAIKILSKLDKGVWSDRKEITGSGGTPIGGTKDYITLNDNELKLEIVKKLEELKNIRNAIITRQPRSD